MRKRKKLRDASPSSPTSSSSPTSMDKAVTSDGLLDLLLLLLLFFFLCSPFVHSNPDSSNFSHVIGLNLKEKLLDSFLSSIDTNTSSIYENPHPEFSNLGLDLVQEKSSVLEKPENATKNENLSRSAYVRLDEIRNKTLQSKKSNAHEVLEKITHRLEPDGKKYNYASASKGAKVLAHNKEAKGAGNILERDEDKYLRNPCSVDGKFVAIELSEETLVDSFNIANLEHYSSNFKDFVLSGSLNYPTETWIPLGNFTAENAKHAQGFNLVEPKWVRYMKLNLVSHYGSEFYCTLSFLEVHGVDAIKKMLENFIAVPDEKPAGDHTVSLKLEANFSVKADVIQKIDRVDATPPGVDVVEVKNDVPKSSVSTQLNEVSNPLSGRIASDTVLKILMQKLSSLELSLSVLEEYTKELDQRYGGSLLDLQKEISQKAVLLEEIGSEVKGLMESKNVLEKELSDLEQWKSTVSAQVDALVKDSAYVRESVETILSNQETMENKELVVLILSMFSACFALFKLTCDRIVSCEPEKMYKTSRGWLLLFVSSGTATLITLLYS